MVRHDQQYPAAAQLFAAYLHQDWPEDAGSWQAAIDQYAAGVKHVLVNGQIVLKDGEHTGATPGRALKGPGAIAARPAAQQARRAAATSFARRHSTASVGLRRFAAN